MPLRLSCHAAMADFVGASAPVELAFDDGSTAVTCPGALAPGTACGAGAVCCPIFMSQSGVGCCHLEGGACCPKSPTTQMCCPKGTKCYVHGYGADCVPDNGGANETGMMVCTPGAKLPPSSSKLPSVIVIGDSVSEGIEPVLAANLSDVAFVQHSPWSGGGGADDVNNGVNCEEEFLRTAMYQPAKWDLISFNVRHTSTLASYNYHARMQLIELPTGSRLGSLGCTTTATTVLPRSPSTRPP